MLTRREFPSFLTDDREYIAIPERTEGKKMSANKDWSRPHSCWLIGIGSVARRIFEQLLTQDLGENHRFKIALFEEREPSPVLMNQLDHYEPVWPPCGSVALNAKVPWHEPGCRVVLLGTLGDRHGRLLNRASLLAGNADLAAQLIIIAQMPLSFEIPRRGYAELQRRLLESDADQFFHLHAVDLDDLAGKTNPNETLADFFQRADKQLLQMLQYCLGLGKPG